MSSASTSRNSSTDTTLSTPSTTTTSGGTSPQPQPQPQPAVSHDTKPLELIPELTTNPTGRNGFDQGPRPIPPFSPASLSLAVGEYTETDPLSHIVSHFAADGEVIARYSPKGRRIADREYIGWVDGWVNETGPDPYVEAAILARIAQGRIEREMEEAARRPSFTRFKARVKEGWRRKVEGFKESWLNEDGFKGRSNWDATIYH